MSYSHLTFHLGVYKFIYMYIGIGFLKVDFAPPPAQRM